MFKTFETVKRIQITNYNNEADPEKKEKIELNALNIFHKAIENCKPVLQLTPVKRGGQTYQVCFSIFFYSDMLYVHKIKNLMFI